MGKNKKIMKFFVKMLGGDNEKAVHKIARALHISDADAQKGIASVLPSLLVGMKKNAHTEGGEEAAIKAAVKHKDALDKDDDFDEEDGKKILGHLVGSEEKTRGVADQASRETGLSSDLLSKLLPMAASMLMGGMGKSLVGGLLGQLLGSGGERGGDGKGGLIMLLDFDHDGDVSDDLMDIAKKFF